MIARTYIEYNLNKLRRKYDKSTSQKDELFYSKLAMLELCGWIEESMDDIIQKCANRSLKTKDFKTHIAKDIIKRNYGFEYNKNFIKMLSSVIGFKNIEYLNEKLDASKSIRLQSTLRSLKKIRNGEAHTHLKGTTRHVDSPYIALSYFQIVYDGLKDIENNLKKINC